MKTRTKAITAVATLALMVQSAIAQAAVGYNNLVVPANSDVLLTTPFTQTAQGNYTVNTVTGTGVTVVDALTAGAFANLYLVRFTSGNAKGLWSTISNNTVSEFQLADAAVLVLAAIGDEFTVYPHQTLGTVFPDGMEGVSFERTTSLISHKTEILLPNTTLIGINKPASEIYFFFNNEWRKNGSPSTSVFNDVVLVPQQYFILRNKSANMLDFITLGQAAAVPVARLISTVAQKNDIAAGSGASVSLTLAQLNLGGTPAFATTTSLISHKDELLVFDNDAAGFNKPASAIYFYFNGAWRKNGQPSTTSFDNEVLDPASSILIRKASGTPGTSTWYQPALSL